jgi:multiple sugar transport system substrate-binding protein
MYRMTLKAALISTAMLGTAVQAQETVEWWDFLGGGDGVRMKTLIDQFNTEHAGSITINAVPYHCRRHGSDGPYA